MYITHILQMSQIKACIVNPLYKDSTHSFRSKHLICQRKRKKHARIKIKSGSWQSLSFSSYYYFCNPSMSSLYFLMGLAQGAEKEKKRVLSQAKQKLERHEHSNQLFKHHLHHYHRGSYSGITRDSMIVKAIKSSLLALYIGIL